MASFLVCEIFLFSTCTTLGHPHAQGPGFLIDVLPSIPSVFLDIFKTKLERNDFFQTPQLFGRETEENGRGSQSHEEHESDSGERTAAVPRELDRVPSRSSPLDRGEQSLPGNFEERLMDLTSLRRTVEAFQDLAAESREAQELEYALAFFL